MHETDARRTQNWAGCSAGDLSVWSPANPRWDTQVGDHLQIMLHDLQCKKAKQYLVIFAQSTKVLHNTRGNMWRNFVPYLCQLVFAAIL